jgi:hypothetical protein
MIKKNNGECLQSLQDFQGYSGAIFLMKTTPLCIITVPAKVCLPA